MMLGLNRISPILETISTEIGTFNNSIFDRLHRYFVDNYIVYYDTIENYKSRTEPSIQRKLHYVEAPSREAPETVTTCSGRPSRTVEKDPLLHYLILAQNNEQRCEGLKIRGRVKLEDSSQPRIGVPSQG